MPFNITKASGESVPFDARKLAQSLERSGVDHQQAEAIARAVAAEVREGISTKAIYRLARRMLCKSARGAAARYSLKQALLEFGPTGFPFEQFIARLLKADGFQVQTSLIRQGRCIPHEIDIFGAAGDRVIVGECKFHNRQNLVSDVKIPLYIHARFHDLRNGFLSEKEWSERHIEGWIFTNTRFTDEALQYGHCAGLQLVSWNTPVGRSLREWVDRTGLHPVTCLTTLTRREKEWLLSDNIVLARDLLDHPGCLEDIRLAPGRVDGVLAEAERLCVI